MITSPNTRQIAAALQLFNEHASSGVAVDTTGTYGPQSTDLMTLYIRDLLGQPDWQWTIGAAKYAIDSPRLREHFNLIAPEDLRLGDIVVLFGKSTSEVGTVGMFVRDHRNGDIEVLSQTPGPPRRMRFMRRDALGGLRYKRNVPAAGRQLVTTTPAEPRATLAAWMLLADAQNRSQRLDTFDIDDVAAGEAAQDCVDAFDEWSADLARRVPAERQHWLKRLFLRGRK